MTGHRKFSELAVELANPDYPEVAERVAAKLAAEDAADEHSLRELLSGPRDCQAITSAGVALPGQVAFNGFGGTYTLLDHLYALGLFNHVAGGFDANGFDVRYSSRR